MSALRVALLPGTLALLPEFAGQVDPVAELRAAALRAVSSTVAGASRVVVFASVDADNLPRGVTVARGLRVARAMLAEVGWAGEVSWAGEFAESARSLGPATDTPAESSRSLACPAGTSAESSRSPAPAADEAWLVVGNGSARRSEKAPGHLDPDAEAFDRQVGSQLAAGDLEALSALSPAESARFLADLTPIAMAAQWLAASATGPAHVVQLMDADPYGVQWWVQAWEVPCDC